MASNIIQRLRAAVMGLNPIVKGFLEWPYIAEYDRIVIFILGGAGGLGRVFLSLFRTFPILKNFLTVVKVDFAHDPVDTGKGDNRLTPLALANGISGTLRQVHAKFGMPEDGYFRAAELARFEELLATREFGDFDCFHGAGAEPVIGKYMYWVSQKVAEKFIREFVEKLMQQAKVKNVMFLAFIGTSGGTGMGIFEEFLDTVASIAHTMGMTGFTSVIKIFCGWRSYLKWMYKSDGGITAKAEQYWERSTEVFYRVQDSFMLATEVGPNGLLGVIQLVAELIAVLNNRFADGAYTNAIISCNEVTPTAIQRIASRLVMAGEKPLQDYEDVWTLKESTVKTGRISWAKRVTVSIKVSAKGCRTIKDMAQYSWFFGNPDKGAKAQLLAKLSEKYNDDAETVVLNWREVDGMIAAAWIQARDVAQELLKRSMATGGFILPDENKPVLINAIRSCDVQAVLDETATVAYNRGVPIALIPPEVTYVSERTISVGSADLRFELGKRLKEGDARAQMPLVLPSYINKTDEEMRQEADQRLLDKAREERLGMRAIRNAE